MGTEAYKQADFFPRRINNYVPAMKYHSQVSAAGVYRADLGTPALTAVTAGTGIANDIDGAPATEMVFDGLAVGAVVGGGVAGTMVAGADATFGRIISFASVPNPHSITVYGWDYLGQYMAETIGAAATSSSGAKAFKRVHKLVVVTGTLSNADIGFGAALGLPFATRALLGVHADEASDDLSAGTFVDALLTDPQTLSTGDPRGTYISDTAMNGTIRFTVTGIAHNAVNASGNGGLHGIQHVSA